MRFDSRIAAGALLGLSALYMIIALASGHTARAEPPPDLSAREAGLDVWRALALRVEHGEQLAVVDVRPAAAFAEFHLPGSRSLPGADAGALREAAQGRAALLLIASTDELAARLVGEARAAGAAGALHFVQGGAQAWYLTLELPVPLFSDRPPPHGYVEARDLLRRWLAGEAGVDAGRLKEAVATLASAGYDANQLAGKKKPAAGTKKKKISGGCG